MQSASSFARQYYATFFGQLSSFMIKGNLKNMQELPHVHCKIGEPILSAGAFDDSNAIDGLILCPE